MPADRLALAIRVGGEDQVGVVLQRIGDRFDMLFAVRSNLPQHVEPIVRIDGSVLGWQIPDMAVAGQNRVIGPEILINCFGFSR